MPVFKGSRYANAEVASAEFAPGDFRPVFGVREPIKEEDVGEPLNTYSIQPGEELDNPAFHFGDRSEFWWVVADINDIVSPLDFVVATGLKVPGKSFFNRL